MVAGAETSGARTAWVSLLLPYQEGVPARKGKFQKGKLQQRIQ